MSEFELFMKKEFGELSDEPDVYYNKSGMNDCWNSATEAAKPRWIPVSERMPKTDMGERPGSKYSIERIDNNGPYSPENCKWATKDDQVNNRRTNKLLHYKGETLTITQWAKKLNIKPATLNGRLLKNWQIERALTEPVKKRS